MKLGLKTLAIVLPTRRFYQLKCLTGCVRAQKASTWIARWDIVGMLRSLSRLVNLMGSFLASIEISKLSAQLSNSSGVWEIVRFSSRRTLWN